MLLTLRVTGEYASDLEVLLDVGPDKLHSTKLPFGHAHVFFPEVSPNAVTAAVVVDIDAVAWSSNGSSEGFRTTNAAALSDAIANVFSTALAARSPRRPDLVTTTFPVEVCISTLALTRGDDVRALFAPLGYEVSIDEHPLDVVADMQQKSVRCAVRLAKLSALYEVLSHVYVLGPVLDDSANDRTLQGQRDALIAHAEGIVRGHPAGDRIMQAYASRRPSNVSVAFDRLLALETVPGQTSVDMSIQSTFLDETRLEAIALELREASAHSVIDLGCGDGKLLARLVREKALTRIVGFDVSHRALEAAAARLKLDRRPGKKSERMELVHGSLFYSDNRLSGFDAAVLADVVQHVPAERLPDAENVVFQQSNPTTIVVLLNEPRSDGSTLTNSTNGWSTNRFDDWASRVSERYGYRVRLLSPGSSSQTTRMAVFSR